MRDTDVSVSFRAAACIIGLIMLATALFSSCLVAAESCHDCSGDGCPVCMRIRQSEDSMLILGECTAAQIAHVLPVFIIILSAALLNTAAYPKTPVSRKVRLDN
ncbi:MAG: hypothetical protein IKT01_00225 [Eubacteriaceae bacterium]|nr:hypothetical protein [Eubacteriaceae bacterium]